MAALPTSAWVEDIAWTKSVATMFRLESWGYMMCCLTLSRRKLKG
jgi:hypothetical protein